MELEARQPQAVFLTHHPKQSPKYKHLPELIHTNPQDFSTFYLTPLVKCSLLTQGLIKHSEQDPGAYCCCCCCCFSDKDPPLIKALEVLECLQWETCRNCLGLLFDEVSEILRRRWQMEAQVSILLSASKLHFYHSSLRWLTSGDRLECSKLGLTSKGFKEPHSHSMHVGAE